MAKKKTITVSIENKQLDALEDLLFAELTDSEKTTTLKSVKKLWLALVEAYDSSEAI